MRKPKQERYFVVGLTQQCYRPVPQAEFSIQILNDSGEGDRVAYFSYSSSDTLAVVDAIKGVVTTDPDAVPRRVVEACRQRNNSPGYYVDEDGEIVPPTFLAPSEAMLDAERARTRRRNQ